MVKLHFHFSSDMLNFNNYIEINEKEYPLNDGTSNITIELIEKDPLVEVDITSKPCLPVLETTNFLKKVIATLILMFVTGWSTEELDDCDFRSFRTRCVLFVENDVDVHLTVNKKVLLKKTIIECSGDVCQIVEQYNECDIDYGYVNALFQDYRRFNCWRTGILLAILFPLLLIGIIRNVVTTVVFSALLIVFVLIGFFYTKKRLVNFLKDVIKNADMK